MRGVLEVPQIGINIDKFLAHFIPTIVRISMQLIPNPQHGSNLSSAVTCRSRQLIDLVDHV